MTPPLHLALLLPSLAGGGVGRVALDLAGAFVALGHRVDLVLCRDAGPYRSQVPPGVRVVALRGSAPGVARAFALVAGREQVAALVRPVLLPWQGAPPLSALPDLVRYLRREQPTALLAAKTHTNLVALWARRLADVETRVLVGQHSVLSEEIASSKGRKWRWRHVAPLVAATYPRAEAIVAVSDAVAEDLARTTGLPGERIATIPNPVDAQRIAGLAAAPVPHPWLAPGQPPVVLGAGRLRASKDFLTLLQAFARLRRVRPARLVVLGEGPERGALTAEAARLGVAADVLLPGFTENPFAWMSRARVFALCSRYEAFGLVLVEALVCGCPVVATDAVGGLREILPAGGGARVPVGDADALSRALRAALDAPADPERGRRHARAFAPERAAARHLDALGLPTGAAHRAAR